MQYGMLIGTNVVALTDMAHGKPVIESEPPYVREGYHIEESWVDDGYSIRHCYDVVPDEGTAAQAALALSRLQFRSLPDAAAYEFRALADGWVAGQSYYGPEDAIGAPQSRVLYGGHLYKCLKSHVAQEGWEPTAAPSLWAVILPGQEGSGVEVGEWVQPDSTNGYSIGDKVIYNGKLWESIVNDNVDVPGTDNGFRWKDLGEVSA